MSNSLDKFDEVCIIEILKDVLSNIEEDIDKENIEFGYRASARLSKLNVEKINLERIIKKINVEI